MMTILVFKKSHVVTAAFVLLRRTWLQVEAQWRRCELDNGLLLT